MFQGSIQRPSGFLENSSFIRHYLWKYRRWVGLGLFALIVVDGIDILPPFLIKKVIDAIVEKNDISLLWQAAGAYLGISVIQAICRYAWRMYLIRASVLAGRDLRLVFVNHLFEQSAVFYEKQKIGDLMSLAVNDVEAIRVAMGAGILVFADALFYLLTIPVAMVVLSPKLTLLACLPLPLIPWIVSRNEKLIHDRFLKVQEGFGRISALVQENMSGIRVVKGYAKENVQQKRAEELGKHYVSLNLELAKVQTLLSPTLEWCMSLGLVILLFVGGGDLIHNTASAVTLGTFVAFQRYLQKMIWPMTALGMAINYYQRAVSSSDRLKKVLGQEPEVKNRVSDESPSVHSQAYPEKHSYLGPGPRRVSGEIELRSVRFSYARSLGPSSAPHFAAAADPSWLQSNAAQSASCGLSGLSAPRQFRSSSEVLQDISFVVEPGQKVALVGEVGSGKSTLLALLPRIYPVGDGQIFIDGVDINHWDLGLLRQSIGYVGQDPFLFSDTVWANIAFGCTSTPRQAQGSSQSQVGSRFSAYPSLSTLDTVEDVSAIALEKSAQVDVSVKKAAQLCQIHQEICALPGGYDTRLGERGVNFSGGQKQRLSLARALAKAPSILVLDDGFSSVDTQTEKAILSSLRGFLSSPDSEKKGMTQLIAAHRISTVSDADLIVVLHQGKVIQQGTHQQLIRLKNTTYSRFYEKQKIQEDLESFQNPIH